MTRRAAIRRHQQLKLNLIFAAVPLILCQGKCQSSCGPIDASPIEKKLFKIATSKPFPNPKKTLRSHNCQCPFLNPLGRCDVYRHRPLICRLWGTAHSMPCPFGCKPNRPLSDADARQLIRDAASL